MRLGSGDLLLRGDRLDQIAEAFGNGLKAGSAVYTVP